MQTDEATTVKGWLRGFAAVMMGLIVAFVVTFGIELINSRIYPLALDPGADYYDRSVMNAAKAQLPAIALGIVVLEWFLAGLTGAWVATRIARGDHRPAWFLGVVLVAGAVRNLLEFPHPVWFWIAGLALYALGIGLGARHGGGAVRTAG
jgi:hypothetical protein